MSQRVVARLKRAALAHPVTLIATATLVLATASVLYVNSRKGSASGRDAGAGEAGGVEPTEEEAAGGLVADDATEALQNVPRQHGISRFLSVGKARKRPLTVSLKNVILWNPSPDPRAPNFAFLEGTLAFLSALAATYELYLVTVVGSEEEAQHVQWVLEQSGLYDSPPPALDRRRVLFCRTEQGKSHIVRHIEPLVHVDTNRQVAEGLARFVKHVVLVQKAGGGGNGGRAGASAGGKPTPANVETCTSILTSSLSRRASQNK